MNQPSAIAHYRIVSKLGEGGMGAVNRATNTKLNRDVAIRVLPVALAGDAQYMPRFEREAQMPAALEPSQYRDRLWCRAGCARELVRIFDELRRKVLQGQVAESHCTEAARGACLRDRGRETGISESGPHGNRLVGSVRVQAGTISSLASLFFHPMRACERTTQPGFLGETSCSFSHRPLPPPTLALGAVAPSWLAENGVILANGDARSPLHAEPAQPVEAWS